MPAMFYSTSTIVFCLFIFSTAGVITSAPLEYGCFGTIPNTNYTANVNLLLSTLSGNATTEDGFFNSTAGTNPDSIVYGLFLCRGDVSADVCDTCVTNATKDMLKLCPNRTEGILYYDYCLLRYSDENIFGVWDQYLIIRDSDNTRNMSKPERFYRILDNLMTELTTRVATDARKGKKFATQEADFTATQKVYALAQCTPDISSDTCKGCLQQAISNLPNSCNKSKSCRLVLLNCFVRYEFFRFYDSKASAPPLVLSAPPPSPPESDDHRGKQHFSARTMIIGFVVPTISIVFITVGFSCFRRKANDKKPRPQDINEGSTIKSLHYDFRTIQDATNNFSVGNRIGRGGFGDVYKGKLPNGQDIAVKRLSRSSNQGGEEFKSEVLLVAKMQHKNLVKLLGFCLHEVERLLIYEFVPNKTLDYYLFDPERQGTLNGAADRVKIIRGIARGLLYLHEDCPLKVVHRDLKPSNILLDSHLEPKISDFGMARIFVSHQSQGNTIRVVGTYGYMSPEYVMYGQYSTKSDVFSFGVVILETVTGKKNSSFCESNEANDLLSYAWKHWKEGTPLELVDSSLEFNSHNSRNEIYRCIQIGLLCVQKDAQKRPTMASVVLMLSSSSVTIPMPQRPAFFARSTKTEIMPKELTSDEYCSYSSMYTDEASVITKQMTNDT